MGGSDRAVFLGLDFILTVYQPPLQLFQSLFLALGEKAVPPSLAIARIMMNSSGAVSR